MSYVRFLPSLLLHPPIFRACPYPQLYPGRICLATHFIWLIKDKNCRKLCFTNMLYKMCVFLCVCVCLTVCLCVCSVITFLALIKTGHTQASFLLKCQITFLALLFLLVLQFPLFSTLSIFTYTLFAWVFWCLFVWNIQEKSYTHIKLIFGGYNHKNWTFWPSNHIYYSISASKITQILYSVDRKYALNSRYAHRWCVIQDFLGYDLKVCSTWSRKGMVLLVITFFWTTSKTAVQC